MTGAAAAFRPFLWLAAVGFLVGFLSYLAFSGPAAALDARAPAWDAAAAPASAPLSGPVSAEWNAPKRI